MFFFFNDTATTEIYTLSLHDALPIFCGEKPKRPGEPFAWARRCGTSIVHLSGSDSPRFQAFARTTPERSEEHTSELQSRQYLVCRLLLEKKNKSTYCLFTSIICI